MAGSERVSPLFETVSESAELEQAAMIAKKRKILSSSPRTADRQPQKLSVLWIAALFFLSGIPALVYQTVW
jgi:hypothetical protein